MKKLLISLLPLLLLFAFTYAWWNITVNNVSSKSQCNAWESDDINLYLTDSSISRWLADDFGNDVDSLIWASWSSVEIWRNWIISDSSCNDWWRVSNVVDHSDSDWVLWVKTTDSCTFNRPNYTKISDPTAIDAQIHYTILYRLIYNDWPNSLTSRLYYRDYGVNDWTCYPGGNTVTDYSSCPQVSVKYGSIKYHTWECLNYRLFRCGDGLRNSPYGTQYQNWTHIEQCDPNDPNHENRWSNWCTLNCLRDDEPECWNWILETWEECELDVNNIFNSFSWNRNSNSNVIENVNTYNMVTLSSNISLFDHRALQWFATAVVEWPNVVKKYFTHAKSSLKTEIDMVQTELRTYSPYANFWNGCDNTCHLTTPTCNFTIEPTYQYVWQPSTFSWSTNLWATYYKLDFDDWIIWNQSQLAPRITWNNYFWLQHIYGTVDIFEPELTVINDYPVALTASGVTRPTAICTWSTEILPGCVIEVVPEEVVYGQSFQVNYTIWWEFNTPIYMWLYPQNPFYYGINQNTWSYITTWTVNILAADYPITGYYLTGIGEFVFSISWTYANESLTPFYCSGAVRVVDWNRKIDIEKTIDHETWYVEWDIVHYTVVVTNNWDVPETNLLIRDTLPLSVTYQESSISFTDATHTSFSSWTWISNQHTILDYSGITLFPWQQAILSITWVANQNIKKPISHVNVACVSGDNMPVTDNPWADYCDTAPIIFLAEVEKTWNWPYFRSWDNVEYYITVRNTSMSNISYVRLDDIWPDNGSCIVYDSWTWDSNLIESTNFSPVSNLSWIYNWTLNIWQTFSFKIFAHIASADCARPEAYHNVINLTYREGTQEYYDDDFYDIWVSREEGTPGAQLTKVVDHHEVSLNDTVVYTISYQNAWDVDRDTWYTLTDIWPSELNYVSSNCNTIATCSEETLSNGNIRFTFNSVLYPGEGGTLQLRWTVARKWTDVKNKINTVVLDYSTIYGWGSLTAQDYIYIKEESNCGNWILEQWEQCDYMAEWDETIYFINWLDYNRRTYSEWAYWYCNSSCRIVNWSHEPDVYQPVSCLNVNTNISVMKDELFPFRWRIWERSNIEIVDQSSDSNRCRYDDRVTKIRKNTMMCNFTVYDWNNYNQANRSDWLNSFSQYCFGDVDNDRIFKYFEWKPYYVDFSTVAARNVFGVATILWKNTDNINTYWEYKLMLHDVEYEYCSKEWVWKKWRITQDVCEVDFALTDHYISQISTFGVTPTVSDADFLDKYYDINGKKLIKKTDIKNIIQANSRTYSSDSDVVNKITAFKNKYEWLAVSLNKSSLNVSSEVRTNITSLKKVPWKSIYFIEWHWSLTLTNSFSDKPFTIVVKWMDIVVEWSIKTNGMFITDGQIKFEDPDCVDGGQVVQWIFIAQWWFGRWTSTLNRNRNRDWCQWWNLHVKWVLIGDNISNIESTKRSHLNSWFVTDTDECKRYVSSSTQTELEACMKKERRNEIFQWASVLIEYNPSLWAMLPPGAEIFTETLEVYRK